MSGEAHGPPISLAERREGRGGVLGGTGANGRGCRVGGRCPVAGGAAAVSGGVVLGGAGAVGVGGGAGAGWGGGGGGGGWWGGGGQPAAAAAGQVPRLPALKDFVAGHGVAASAVLGRG